MNQLYASDTSRNPQTYMEAQLENHNISIELIKQEIKQEFAHMKEGMDNIASQISNLERKLVEGFISKEQFNNLESRVKSIENGNTWVIRLIIGAVIVALLASIGLMSAK